jgi:diamine N-acetyltransferase
MKVNFQIRLAGNDDIETIRNLAYKIWPEAYKDILSTEQLNYMLNLIYNPIALAKQMDEYKHQFLLIEESQVTLGFASFNKLEEGIFKLQKLYVSPFIQGKGLGKALLEKVKDLVIEAGATELRLNVNKHNKARGFYEKEGFEILFEEEIPIGNGYVMDDYVMYLQLSKSRQ